jgi:hypothetical protein
MWFNQPADGRIPAWRSWRNSLENLSPEEAMNCVAETWARVPTVMHYLSPDQPNHWPNPWQLVVDNIYCDLSICLGMFYSLALIENPKFEDLTIKIYQSKDGWVNLSSVDQGKYVLNYNYRCVVNSACINKDGLELIFDYSKIDLCNKFN